VCVCVCTQFSHKESLSKVLLSIRLAAKHNRDSAGSCEWWVIKLNEQEYIAAHVKEDMKNATKTSCWPVGRGSGTVHGMYLKLATGFMQKVLSSMTK
jgi:hypothetical protein